VWRQKGTWNHDLRDLPIIPGFDDRVSSFPESKPTDTRKAFCRDQITRDVAAKKAHGVASGIEDGMNDRELIFALWVIEGAGWIAALALAIIAANI
jgi:hypothetical protein